MPSAPWSHLLVGCAVVHALGCTARGEVLDGSFVAAGNDTVARFFHRASRLDSGEVVVTGGLRVQFIPASLISRADVSFFDPGSATFSATWTPTGGGPPVSPVLLTAHSSHTQTTLADGRVLVTGGHVAASGTSPGTPTATVEVFDPATGLFDAGPAMSGPRTAHTATRLGDGRVVVAGAGTWQVFTPGSDTWSAAAALQRSRAAHAAVRLPDHGGPGLDRVLLVGGAGSGPRTLERLDPDAGTSTLLAPALTTGVDDLAATRLDDGTVLIVGGQATATGDTLADSYRYDPVADTLTSVPAPPDVPQGISDHAMVSLGRFAVVFGGEQQVSGTDTELDVCCGEYDRVQNDWLGLPSMIDVHDDFAAVTLADGRVLLVGGGVPFLGQTVPSDAAELFVSTMGAAEDVDCDGTVGVGDLLLVLAAWGACPAPGDCAEDVDADHLVNIADLLAVLAAWS